MPDCACTDCGVNNMTKKKHPGGRPTVMTETTVGKLESAFSWGCTDIEACLYAGINPDTLYEYYKKNPKFSEHKERLKETPNLKARQVLNLAIQQKDKQAAQWWLERKKKEEFSTRSELVQPEPIKVFVTKAEQDEADAVIDDVVTPRDDSK